MAVGSITNDQLYLQHTQQWIYPHTSGKTAFALIRNRMKEWKQMKSQSLCQLVSTYTACTTKILQWNITEIRAFLGYSPEIPCSGIFFHLHVTFAQFLFHFLNSCLCFCICLACWHLFCFLLIYFSGCSSCVQFVYHRFVCVLISLSGFYFCVYLFVSVKLSFLVFLVSLNGYTLLTTKWYCNLFCF